MTQHRDKNSKEKISQVFKNFTPHTTEKMSPCVTWLFGLQYLSPIQWQDNLHDVYLDIGHYNNITIIYDKYNIMEICFDSNTFESATKDAQVIGHIYEIIIS